MRTLAVKLGDLDPHEDADRWFIWLSAVEEFLWPTSKHDKDQTRITLHPMFLSWCSEWGDRRGVIEGVLNHIYPDAEPIDLFYGRESVRLSALGKDGGLSVAIELDTLWNTAWKAIAETKGSGRGYSPRIRHSSRGIKFCLLYLILHFGVFDGSPPVNGRHRLVRWCEALDAAALMLALTFFRAGGDRDVNPFTPSWQEIKELAKKRLNPSTENPRELKNHADDEGIDGFRKRVKATLDDAAFRRVASLAAEFESKAASCMIKWRNNHNLHRWFMIGKD